VTEDRFLGGRVIVRQPETGFRAGLDAVMLAAAVPEAGKVLELGAGAGTASLCLTARLAESQVTGLEIDLELVALATANAEANGTAGRVRFAAADIFDLPEVYRRQFNHVLSNPPFHDEAGQAAPDPARARALQDGGRLAGWLEIGLKRTVSGGTFTAILRADRLGEALAALPERGVTVFPLWPRVGVAAKRVILQARQGSRAPLVMAAGLVLHRDDGSYTAEADAVLRSGAGLRL
jgi:tRNA1Val (adenine37-N6)-methyltransferase